jgi:DNA mismatch endonuclease (patch repair protein)
MADHLSPQGRSRNMAAIQSKNTKPERLLREELRRIGLTGYRIHPKVLPGKPDIAYTKWKVAVFTDGAYWHGHPEHTRADASDYWRTKIARTQERDRIADDTLRSAGWTVLRLWDFDVLHDPAAAATTVACALRRAGRTGTSPRTERTATR